MAISREVQTVARSCNGIRSLKKYSDGMSCVGVGGKNLNDFYYPLGIRIPFMTSVREGANKFLI